MHTEVNVPAYLTYNSEPAIEITGHRTDPAVSVFVGCCVSQERIAARNFSLRRILAKPYGRTESVNEEPIPEAVFIASLLCFLEFLDLRRGSDKIPKARREI